MRGFAARAGLRRAAAACLIALTSSAALPVAAPADAAEAKILESRFLVMVRTAGGDVRRLPGNRVPLIPGHACYSWGIRLDKPPGLVKFKEVFTLPAPLADWGTDRDFSTSKVINGGRAAVTERFATPHDGWIENTWCVGAKDPAGHHTFEVFLDNMPVGTFPFDVVPVR